MKSSWERMPSPKALWTGWPPATRRPIQPVGASRGRGNRKTPALSAGLAVQTAERTKISVRRLAKELYTEAFSGASFGTGRCDSDLGPELRPMSGLSEGTPELFNPAGPRDQFVA